MAAVWRCLLWAIASLVVCSATVVASKDDAPTQIHLSQGDMNGNAITVSWVTNEVNVSVVLIRTAGGEHTEFMGRHAAERYAFLSAFDTVPYVSGLIHHVTIEGLLHGTIYIYRCGSDEGGWSVEYSFSTPPRPSAGAAVTFAVLGDLGQTPYSRQNMKEMLADASLKSLVVLGDLSYADSEQQSLRHWPCTQKRWDSWFMKWQPLFATMPIMTLPGNHEVEHTGAPPPATQEKFLAYKMRLRMPSDGRLYYSYNFGSVHLIMLNSYENFKQNSEQYAFLEKDLAVVDRQVTPWLLVNFHAPWYSSITHHADEPPEREMRKAMEDLLYREKVDLVFSGHVHNYERMHPVHNNRTTPGAPTHIVVGDGGNREGPALGFLPQPEWSAFRLAKTFEPLQVFGHGRVHVANATHLHFKWSSLQKGNGSITDAVWFVKNEALQTGISQGVKALPG